MLVIIGGRVLTMAGQAWEKGYVCVAAGKIKAVGPLEPGQPFLIPEAFREAEVLHAEGGTILPGLIEAHCHIGIMEEKTAGEGNDGNENVQPLSPWLRGIDGINTMDAAFGEAVRAGITSAMIGPGSANVVGGQFALLKTWGRCVDDLLIAEPAAMKVAFGENPKANYRDQGKSPVSRMAIAGLLRQELTEAVSYLEQRKVGKREKEFRYECWIPVLEKKIPLKAHVHRLDDIFTAIRIAKEFDLDMTLDHCTEGYLAAERIGEEGYPVIVGPDLTIRNKIEVQNRNFQTVGILNRAGIKTAITTDHPMTPIQTLPLCAGLAVKAGMDENEALKSITIYPAEICGAAHRIGSLEAGKDADVSIFSGNPLEIMTKTLCTIIDGQIAHMDKEWKKSYNGTGRVGKTEPMEGPL